MATVKSDISTSDVRPLRFEPASKASVVQVFFGGGVHFPARTLKDFARTCVAATRTPTSFPTLTAIPRSGLQASPITACFQNRRDKNYFQVSKGDYEDQKQIPRI